VSSSAFPKFARNLNTLEPIATAREARIAKNRVFHDSIRASHLMLPVVVRRAGDKIRFVENRGN
jgi:predicted acyl esterase